MIVGAMRAIRDAAVRLLAVTAAVAVAVGAIFVLGMRAGSPTIQGAVRRMNRAVWNPKAMETAGTPGVSTAVVHHVGRRSGRSYATPVVPVATEDGFVVPLPYGTRADWVRNVLVAGRARLDHDGRTHEVDRPEVVPMERVEAHFGDSDRRVHRAFRVERCLRLHRVDGTVRSPGGPRDASSAAASAR